MSSFDETFNEPLYMSNGSYALSGEYTKEQAAEIFSEYTGDEIDPSTLDSDRVRFGFPPEHIEDREDLPRSCWYTAAGEGKGTKPIWIIG